MDASLLRKRNPIRIDLIYLYFLQQSTNMAHLSDHRPPVRRKLAHKQIHRTNRERFEDTLQLFVTPSSRLKQSTRPPTVYCNALISQASARVQHCEHSFQRKVPLMFAQCPATWYISRRKWKVLESVVEAELVDDETQLGGESHEVASSVVGSTKLCLQSSVS